MSYYFTSEGVTGGHPDKVADQISDALLDEFLRRDPDSKVACETLCTTGLVVLSGEVRTEGYVDVQQTVRRVVNNLGYNDPSLAFAGNSCGVLSTLEEQSPDIFRGVNRAEQLEQGAGDQGMMFGFACTETDDYMPLGHVLNNIILMELTREREEGVNMPYLRPDGKSQVTMRYSDSGVPEGVETILISTQHDDLWGEDEAAMQKRIGDDVRKFIIPRVRARLSESNRRLLGEDYRLLINPTGKFVIGGPHGDTGLTGRKIIVDTYGGYAPHGGGAFSGKDSSKVDRSASYGVRHIAKNMVAAGVAERVTVQVAYAIGIAKPLSLTVNTHGTSHVKRSDGELARVMSEVFDMRPAALVERFGLKNPIYLPTAAYGHMGRTPYNAKVQLLDVHRGGKEEMREVTFFGWERLDYVDKVRKALGL